MDETLRRFIDRKLEDMTFEEILEYFDLEPGDAFIYLFHAGLIDEELLDEISSVDV